MSYVQFGPFVDGGSPGVSAEFLNPLETFLLSLNSASYDSHISSNGAGIVTLLGLIANGAMQPNPVGTVLNGSTSGTATLYQSFTGTDKRIIIVLNNFRNGSAPAQTIVFPTAFASRVYGRSGGFPPAQLIKSGSAINVIVITALGVAGGTTSSSTSFGSYSLFDGPACDTISFTGSQSGATTGILILEGV